MKRFISVLAVSMLLVSCSGKPVARFALSFDIADTNVQQALTLTSMRVVERRVEHLGEELVDKQINTKGSGTTLTLTLKTSEGIKALISELTAPFSMRVMVQTGSGETADISVEGHGSFRETGITEKDLEWVDARKDPVTGKGEVRMDFTADGKEKMKVLFKQVKGKNIGLFVRDRLVSQLHVETDIFPNTILIRDVPSAELAQVFADDMVVGLHVTFTLLP